MLYAPDYLMVINKIATECLHRFREVYSYETNARKFKHDLIHEHVIADMQLNSRALNQQNYTRHSGTAGFFHNKRALFYFSSYNIRTLLSPPQKVQNHHTYYMALQKTGRLKCCERAWL